MLALLFGGLVALVAALIAVVAVWSLATDSSTLKLPAFGHHSTQHHSLSASQAGAHSLACGHGKGRGGSIADSASSSVLPLATEVSSCSKQRYASSNGVHKVVQARGGRQSASQGQSQNQQLVVAQQTHDSDKVGGLIDASNEEILRRLAQVRSISNDLEKLISSITGTKFSAGAAGKSTGEPSSGMSLYQPARWSETLLAGLSFRSQQSSSTAPSSLSDLSSSHAASAPSFSSTSSLPTPSIAASELQAAAEQTKARIERLLARIGPLASKLPSSGDGANGDGAPAGGAVRAEGDESLSIVPSTNLSTPVSNGPRNVRKLAPLSSSTLVPFDNLIESSQADNHSEEAEEGQKIKKKKGRRKGKSGSTSAANTPTVCNSSNITEATASPARSPSPSISPSPSPAPHTDSHTCSIGKDGRLSVDFHVQAPSVQPASSTAAHASPSAGESRSGSGSDSVCTNVALTTQNTTAVSGFIPSSAIGSPAHHPHNQQHHAPQSQQQNQQQSQQSLSSSLTGINPGTIPQPVFVEAAVLHPALEKDSALFEEFSNLTLGELGMNTTYAFHPNNSSVQRKIKQHYDELVKANAEKTISLAQIGRFTACLVEAKATLQQKSETIQRKFTITKSLLAKADKANNDRLCAQIHGLKLEQKKLEEDIALYNHMQEQLKQSPAYKKMLEYGKNVELAASGKFMDGEAEEEEEEEISFEELLAQEKKDAFWETMRKKGRNQT